MEWNDLCESVPEKKKKKRVLPKWILEVKKINNPPTEKIDSEKAKKIEKNPKKEKENLIKKMFKTQENKNKNKAKLEIEKNKVKDLIKKIEEKKPREKRKRKK